MLTDDITRRKTHKQHLRLARAPNATLINSSQRMCTYVNEELQSGAEEHACTHPVHDIIPACL